MPDLYLDLESVPDLSVPPADRVEAGFPPSNYKSEAAIAKWHAAHPPSDEAWRRTGLDRFRLRVLTVAFAVDDGPIHTFAAEYEEHTPEALDAAEKRVLMALCEVLAVYDVFSGAAGTTRWITFNGSGFDLPILGLRAAKYGLRSLGQALPLARYDKRGLDLQEALKLGQWGNVKGRQQDYCRYLGVELQEGIDGAGVYDAWAAGDLDAVEHHNGEDVRELRDLHAKLVAGGVLPW